MLCYAIDFLCVCVTWPVQVVIIGEAMAEEIVIILDIVVMCSVHSLRFGRCVVADIS